MNLSLNFVKVRIFCIGLQSEARSFMVSEHMWYRNDRNQTMGLSSLGRFLLAFSFISGLFCILSGSRKFTLITRPVPFGLKLIFTYLKLYRVFVNRKISATVAWMIVSGPSSSFYASTILGQPTLYQESHMDVSEWKEVHLEFYVPFVTVIFAMALVGMATSVMSLVVRYREFRSKPFSPAHVAFCFATLNHANACQAYLATLDSYLSDSWRESVFRVVYYYYW